MYSSVDKLSFEALKDKINTKLRFFYSDDTFLKPNHFQIYSIFFRLVQIDLKSSVLHAFLFRRQKKKFPFYNQSFFVISPEDPIHSSIFHGIICGRLWGSLAVSGSFAVGDHLRYCTVLVSIFGALSINRQIQFLENLGQTSDDYR